MFAPVRMRVAIRFDEIVPREISRGDAAFGFAFTPAAMTTGAIHSGGRNVHVPDHRHDFLLTRSLATKIDRPSAPLGWSQRSFLCRRFRSRWFLLSLSRGNYANAQRC